VSRPGRANAAFSRKVSVNRDSGNCVVGPGVVAPSLIFIGLEKGAGEKVPLKRNSYF
jgi:hypothetical protein